eukprot:248536-Chlamydomonas_euryale.AAC.2
MLLSADGHLKLTDFGMSCVGVLQETGSADVLQRAVAEVGFTVVVGCGRACVWEGLWHGGGGVVDGRVCGRGYGMVVVGLW